MKVERRLGYLGQEGAELPKLISGTFFKILSTAARQSYSILHFVDWKYKVVREILDSLLELGVFSGLGIGRVSGLLLLSSVNGFGCSMMACFCLKLYLKFKDGVL